MENQSDVISKSLHYYKPRIKILASTCSASYFFARAGMLRGRQATSAWWLMQDLQIKFSSVDWKEPRSLVVDGKIVTTGAGFSALDLAKKILSKRRREKIGEFLQGLFLLPANKVEQKAYAKLVKKTDSAFSKRLDGILMTQWPFVSLDSLAQGFGMSLRTFIRHFNKQMGMSPGRWLQLQRIEKAKVLLLANDAKLESVCYDVGYENISSFTRLFQREVGLTPAEFRRARLR